MPFSLDDLVSDILASPRYRGLDAAFVRRVAAAELAKRGHYSKDALKAIKAKLHQVGGAYLDRAPEPERWLAALANLPADPADPALRAFCRETMRWHASTRERLPILEEIFTQALAPVGPLESVLDLACGLNPLCAPWMPLAPGASYAACDIYPALAGFAGAFLNHIGLQGEGFVCDLTQSAPQRPVQLAMALKTLPCLEQVDKKVSLRLLDEIQAAWLLVSFPLRSLGGRSKGMTENYSERFRALLAQRAWPYQEFVFSNELAYLIHKDAL